MGRSYTVNRRPKRPSQFPYVCSLLVFLVFLLLIYLLSYFLKSSAEHESQGGSASGSHVTQGQSTKTITEKSTSTQSIYTESPTFTTIEPEIVNVGGVQTTQNDNIVFITNPSTSTKVVNVTSTTGSIAVTFSTKSVNASTSQGVLETDNPIVEGTFNNVSTTSSTRDTSGATFGEILTAEDTNAQNYTTQKFPVYEQFTDANNGTIVTQITTAAENINIEPLLPKTTRNNSPTRLNTFTHDMFDVINVTSKTEGLDVTATPFTLTRKTQKPTEPVKFLRIVSEDINEMFFTNKSTTSSPLHVITRLTTKMEPEAPTITEKQFQRNEVFLTNASTASINSLHVINRLTTTLEPELTPTITEKPFKFEENTTYLNRIVTSPRSSTKSKMLSNEDSSSKKLNTTVVCEIPECQRLAAEMLVLQNHDVGPCDDFYDYACGGRAPLDHTTYQTKLKKNLLNALYMDTKVPSIFKEFYFNCRNFSLDFYFLERGRDVEGYEADVSKFFVDLTLHQTLYFFDVTLGIGEGLNVMIEITTANLFSPHVLKTTIDRFSVLEYFRSKCVDFEEKFPPALNGSTKMSVMSCVFDKITAYVKRYCNQKTCEAKVLNVLLDLLDFQRQVVVEPIKMSHSFVKIRHLPRNKIGLDWLKYFQALFPDITEDTMVLVNSEYFQTLWKKFDEHFDSIRQALLLWHNIQSYKRAMIILNDNNEDSCLDMSIELMPDIGTFLVHRQTTNTNHKLDETIFAPLVKILASYITVENLKNTYYRSSLLMKLSDIKLQSTIVTNYRLENYGMLHLEESDGHGQYNIVQMLLRNYRKMVYSLAGSKISPKILLTFFVNPLDTNPKAFPNTNYIIYHPQFSSEYSPSLPMLIQMAKYGYPISRELWKILLDYESDSETYSFSIESHDPMMYNSLMKSLFTNQPSVESPILEMMENELVIENAAFRLLTETYEKYPVNRDSLVYMNFTHTAAEIFTLAAAQGFCMESQSGRIISDISKDKVPAKMIVDNIVMNSKFFYNTFHCDDDHAYFNAQFPFVRTADPSAFGVED